MKKLSLLLLLLSALSLSSCKQDEPEYVDFLQLESLGKHFVPFGEQTITIEPSMEKKASSVGLADIARGVLQTYYGSSIHQVSGTYVTTGIDGEPITVSGAIFYPTSGPIHNILLCCHYTVAADYEAPSQTFPMEASLAAKGYLVVMPDYIGYGVTVDQVHPYLQHHLTALTCMDMLLAVRPFIAERNIHIQSEKIVNIGYSQGGSAVAFVHYMMENMPLYDELFDIKKTWCGGGPYFPTVTYSEFLRTGKTEIPYAIPLTILGMNEGVDEKFDMAYFFQEPLLSHYPEWIHSKKYNGAQINKLIGTTQLDKILTPAACDTLQPQTDRLMDELRENNLPYFEPRAPMHIFHSETDNVVPVANYYVLRDRWQAQHLKNIDYLCEPYGSHQAGFIAFMTLLKDEL